MPDYIAEAAQQRLVDGTAFEISVIVSPVARLIRDLPKEALRIAAPGFPAYRMEDAALPITQSDLEWIDIATGRQLEVVLVGDITTTYQTSNRDPQQFGATYRVGILREDG